MSRFPAIALVLFAVSSAGAAEKVVDRTFTVSPGGLLTVDADGASVQVSGGDTNQIVVHMIARAPKRISPVRHSNAVQKDGGVTVTMRREKRSSWFSWGSWKGDGNIEVTVPRHYAVNLHTSGGSLELRDTTGSATMRTSGGDISARNVNGNVEVRTSGGGIVVDTIRGDVDADTSGGDVRLLNIDGKIRGNTSGGNVQCSLVGANRGISATTSGGDIQLTVPRATTGNVDATTSGGDITSDLPIASTQWKEGQVKGSLNGGGQPIYVRTSGGGITLRAVN